MKKDDALQRRDQLISALRLELEGLALPALTEDSKLYHDEIEGENCWAIRLSRPGIWPHVGAGGPSAPPVTPGLRYEIWLFQKREEALIGLVCPRPRMPASVLDALKPWWKEWVEGGKFARRYKPLDALWLKRYPDSLGIWRSTPLDEKLERHLCQLVRDTLPGLQKALDPILSQGELAKELAKVFADSATARNPLQELAQHFGGDFGGSRGVQGRQDGQIPASKSSLVLPKKKG